MNHRSIVAAFAFAAAVVAGPAFAAEPDSVATEPDSIATEPSPPPAKRARLSAPT